MLRTRLADTALECEGGCESNSGPRTFQSTRKRAYLAALFTASTSIHDLPSNPSPHRNHHNTNIDQPAAISNFSALHHNYGGHSFGVHSERETCVSAHCITNQQHLGAAICLVLLTSESIQHVGGSFFKRFYHFALVWPTRAAQSRNIYHLATHAIASGRGKSAFYRI